MAVEYVSDKVPMQIHNKSVKYEDAAMQAFLEVLRAMRDTGMDEAKMELQARLYIGFIIKGKSTKFIQDNYTKYYNEEFNNITDNSLTGPMKKNMAIARTWSRLITEANDTFINKYKIDGSKAKIAIIDDRLPDGRKMIDAEDAPIIEYTNDNAGI